MVIQYLLCIVCRPSSEGLLKACKAGVEAMGGQATDFGESYLVRGYLILTFYSWFSKPFAMIMPFVKTWVCVPSMMSVIIIFYGVFAPTNHMCHLFR